MMKTCLLNTVVMILPLQSNCYPSQIRHDTMVCEKCEKKKMKGKGETSATRSRTYEAEGARDSVGANKLLANKKHRWVDARKHTEFDCLQISTIHRCADAIQKVQNMQTARALGVSVDVCSIPKYSLLQVGWNYCQNCAYKNGVCAMCGARMYNVKQYVQRTV